LKEPFDEFSLSFAIRGPIVAKTRRQRALQSTVRRGVRIVSTQIISQGQVAPILLALRRAHIKMMSGSIRRSGKCFASRNPEVALMNVSECSEPLDNLWQVRAGFQ